MRITIRFFVLSFVFLIGNMNTVDAVKDPSPVEAAFYYLWFLVDKNSEDTTPINLPESGKDSVTEEAIASFKNADFLEKVVNLVEAESTKGSGLMKGDIAGKYNIILSILKNGEKDSVLLDYILEELPLKGENERRFMIFAISRHVYSFLNNHKTIDFSLKYPTRIELFSEFLAEKSSITLTKRIGSNDLGGVSPEVLGNVFREFLLSKNEKSDGKKINKKKIETSVSAFKNFLLQRSDKKEAEHIQEMQTEAIENLNLQQEVFTEKNKKANEGWFAWGKQKALDAASKAKSVASNAASKAKEKVASWLW